MAQWKPGPFDVVYDDKLNANLQLLRAAADAWAAGGPAALCVDDVLSVLIHVFARPWSGNNVGSERADKARRLAEWLAHVRDPEQACAALARGYEPQRAEAALAELRTLLRCAARSWSTGTPEDPPTEAVLHDLAQALFRHRLLRRPPPARIDDCFGAG